MPNSLDWRSGARAAQKLQATVSIAWSLHPSLWLHWVAFASHLHYHLTRTHLLPKRSAWPLSTVTTWAQWPQLCGVLPCRLEPRAKNALHLHNSRSDPLNTGHAGSIFALITLSWLTLVLHYWHFGVSMLRLVRIIFSFYPRVVYSDLGLGSEEAVEAPSRCHQSPSTWPTPQPITDSQQLSPCAPSWEFYTWIPCLACFLAFGQDPWIARTRKAFDLWRLGKLSSSST